MAFFGLAQPDLDKRAFQQGQGGGGGGGFHEEEDLAVYTWGEEGYDGLGDALQEGGDDFNDETFGGSGAVGKDFDFGGATLPLSGMPAGQTKGERVQAVPPLPAVATNEPKTPGTPAAPRAPSALDSMWDSKSPFSVLLGASGGRHKATSSQATSTPGISALPSPGLARAHQHHAHPQQQPVVSDFSAQHTSQPRAQPHHVTPRTLQEIEAEMVAAARSGATSQQSHHEQPSYQSQHPHPGVGGPSPRPGHSRTSSEVYAQQEQQRLLQIAQMQQAVLLQQQQQQQLMQQERQRLLRLEQQTVEQQRVQELERLLRAQRFSDSVAEQRQLQEQLFQTEQRVQVHQQREQYLARQEQQQRLAQLQELQQQAQQQFAQVPRRASPGVFDRQGLNGSPIVQQQPQIAQNVQMQQRLLYELSQAEFLQRMNGGPIEDQETLRAQAMQKIMEAEKLEEKRRRKAGKIAHMARYNDLMTQSDKDFITRIQVSQLVTSDPYAEDFYAQIWSNTQYRRAGMRGQSNGRNVLKFGAAGGVATGVTGRGAGRRPNALQRMEQQVERIVQNAKLREKEKGGDPVNHSLHGALGKTAGRSYKAAPRQLLQVDGTVAPSEVSEGSANHTREALIKLQAAKEGEKVEPLTRRESLIMLERLFDAVLSLEQHRRARDHLNPDDPLAFETWENELNQITERVLETTPVRVPWNACVPHPLASLMTPSKGKRLLPRITRHLNLEQQMMVITLIVAIYGQMEVIVKAPLLDHLADTAERRDLERETETFIEAIVATMNTVIGVCQLRYVSGMIDLLCGQDVKQIAQSQAGVALLTLFMSRVQVIGEDINNGSIEHDSLPTAEEFGAWEHNFDRLFQFLSVDFLALFPSTRIAALAPDADKDVMNTLDQPVWQFLALLALNAQKDQHSVMVLQLREKLMDLMLRVKHGWITSEEDEKAKLGNINTFLTAVGLNMSQILGLLDQREQR